jgi:2-oxoisovalerate dehydrogenase E1 component
LPDTSRGTDTPLVWSGSGPDPLHSGDRELSLHGPGQELIEHLRAVLGDPASTAAAAADPRVSASTERDLLALLEAQAASRWLDVAIRRLRGAGRAFAPPTSAGHEGNAAVALALRPTDPGLLHQRSTAFYLARAAQAGRADGVREAAASLLGALDAPGGGRQAVAAADGLALYRHAGLASSHLPRAVGIGWAIGRAQGHRSGRGDAPPGRSTLRWPADSVVVASFGDTAAGHASATGAVTALSWASEQGVPMPVLLVCEDNGLGGSSRTPRGWVRSQFDGRPGLGYLYADTADPLRTLEIAREAAWLVRERRRPVLLHLACVRIGGEFESDDERAYRSAAEIDGDLARDPLAATVRVLVRTGVLSAQAVRERLDQIRRDVTAAVAKAVGRPRATGAAQVASPLRMASPAAVADRVTLAGRAMAGGDHVVPAPQTQLTLAETINQAVLDSALIAPRLVLLGHDVARRGGRYRVTAGLRRKLGAARVVDATQDEQTLLGLALGAAMSGLLPVVELRSPAHLYSALHLLRAEAAGQRFRSVGGAGNPLLLRVPFGGRAGDGIADDLGLGPLRDIPGLVIACPAHPSDAAAMFRSCLAAAAVGNQVCVVLEPVPLYDERDMLSPGDGAWCSPYAPPALWGFTHVPLGRASTWGTGQDLTIAAYGTGVRMALRTAARLAADGIGARVVDLRWLMPLPVQDVVKEAAATGRLLVVDETRRTGGVSEGLVTAVLEAGYTGRMARVTAPDSFVPDGESAGLVLLGEDQIEAAARSLLG